MKNKKPSLAIIMGMKPKGDDEEMHKKEEGDEGESPHVDAAHSVLDAIKAGNAELLSDALKTFYRICKEEGDEGEEY